MTNYDELAWLFSLQAKVNQETASNMKLLAENTELISQITDSLDRRIDLLSKRIEALNDHHNR